MKAHLEVRRHGTENIPPEKIEDLSPVIRNEWVKDVRPISAGAIHRLIGRLYAKTGIRQAIGGKSIRYDLRAHSIRKFFRTQLGSLSAIPTDYIEYMMGHTISTYNDVKGKSIDFLRNLYAQSGLSIRPKTAMSKIEQLKTIIEAWGMNPNQILSREAST